MNFFDDHIKTKLVTLHAEENCLGIVISRVTSWIFRAKIDVEDKIYGGPVVEF